MESVIAKHEKEFTPGPEASVAIEGVRRVCLVADADQYEPFEEIVPKINEFMLTKPA